MEREEICNMCNGTGICTLCDGQGKLRANEPCEMCDGTGVCLCQKGTMSNENSEKKADVEESFIKTPTHYIKSEIKEHPDFLGNKSIIAEPRLGTTQPSPQFTSERMRAKVDAIPTQSESIRSEDYLNLVNNNLLADGFATRLDFHSFPQLIASTIKTLGWFPLPVLVAVGYIERINIESIENFNHQVRDLARGNRQERNNLVIAALCSENIPPATIKWIQKVSIPKVKNYHSLPVVFDLSTQEINYNRDRGMWGSQIYSRMKYFIGKYLDTSPQAKPMKKPKGLEIFLSIICIIMLISLILIII